MATARVLTADDWNDRAEALAVAHGLDGRAELQRITYAEYDRDGFGCDATDTYAVPSSSHAGVWHQVAHHVRSHTLRCDCRAAEYGRPCGHVGSVLLEISTRGIALKIWRAAVGWEEVKR